MDGRKITSEELEAATQGEFKHLVTEVAEAMNAAQPGRIIADSEEPRTRGQATFQR